MGGAAGRGAIVAIIVFRHVRGILDDGGSDAGLVREESRVRREVFVVLVLARVAGCSSRQEPWRPSMAEGNVSCILVSLWHTSLSGTSRPSFLQFLGLMPSNWILRTT